MVDWLARSNEWRHSQYYLVWTPFMHCWHGTIEGDLKCITKSFTHAKIFGNDFLEWEPNEDDKIWEQINDSRTLPF